MTTQLKTGNSVNQLHNRYEHIQLRKSELDQCLIFRIFTTLGFKPGYVLIIARGIFGRTVKPGLTEQLLTYVTDNWTERWIAPLSILTLDLLFRHCEWIRVGAPTTRLSVRPPVHEDHIWTVKQWIMADPNKTCSPILTITPLNVCEYWIYFLL